MTTVQLGLFDLGDFDAEKAYEYRRKQRKAATDAAILTLVGKKKYDQMKQKEARFETEYQVFMKGYQRSPELQASLDTLKARVLASAKPFLTEELALLGIEAGASKRDVRNAYRRKARKLHPDVGGDPDAFKQLHTAYRKILKAAQE